MRVLVALSLHVLLITSALFAPSSVLFLVSSASSELKHGGMEIKFFESTVSVEAALLSRQHYLAISESSAVDNRTYVIWSTDFEISNLPCDQRDCILRVRDVTGDGIPECLVVDTECVRLVDGANGTKLAEVAFNLGLFDEITDVAAVGDYVVVGATDGKVRILNLADLSVLAVLDVGYNLVYAYGTPTSGPHWIETVNDSHVVLCNDSVVCLDVVSRQVKWSVLDDVEDILYVNGIVYALYRNETAKLIELAEIALNGSVLRTYKLLDIPYSSDAWLVFHTVGPIVFFVTNESAEILIYRQVWSDGSSYAGLELMDRIVVTRYKYQWHHGLKGATMICDLTGDGIPELAVIVNKTLAIYDPVGKRIFTSRIIAGSYSLADCVVTSDLTGDGIPEIFLRLNYSIALMECRLVNDSCFTMIYSLWSMSIPADFAEPLCDLDGDGAVEIVVVASQYWASCVWGNFDGDNPEILEREPKNETYTNSTVVTLYARVVDPTAGLESVKTHIIFYILYRNGSSKYGSFDKDMVLISDDLWAANYSPPNPENIIYVRLIWDVTATDLTGHQVTSDDYILWIDLDKPTLEIRDPANGSYFAIPNVTVRWKASDNFGLDCFELYLNGSLIANLSEEVREFQLINLTDGLYLLKLKAYDIAGNVRVSEIVFWVDTTAPRVEISTPKNEEILLESLVTIAWNATDNIGLERIELYIDGQLEATLSPDVREWAVELSDGWHVATVKVYDKAGNSAESSVRFAVDTESPRVKIVQPENWSAIGSLSFSVEWIATDEVGISRIYVCINETCFEFGPEVTNVTVNVSQEAYYVIVVVALDYANYTGFDYVIVLVDITPPSIVIVEPANMTFSNETTVRLEWNASDNFGLNKFVVYINDTLYCELDPAANCCEVRISDGVYVLRVVAYDLAMNENSSKVLIYVDSTPPVVKIVKPREGSFIANSTVVVELSYRDTFEVVEVAVFVDDVLLCVLYPPNSTVVVKLSDGLHVVRAVAYDEVGNVGESTVHFYVDTVPPEVMILSPRNGTYLRTRNVSVEWNASDNIGIAKFEVYVNGERVAILDPTLRSIVLAELSDGKYEVILVACDHAGNNATSAVAFYVDLTPPEIRIKAPANWTITNTTKIELIWTASDNIALSHFEIYVNESLVTVLPADVRSFALNLSEGVHMIAVIAYDRAENSRSSRITVVVDITPPTLVITGPSRGAIVVSASITVTWTGDDDLSGIDHFEVRIDKSAWIDVGRALNYTFTGVSDGTHTIEVKAIDRAGNVVVMSVTITVVYTSLVVGAVGISAIAVILVLVRRRKMKS